MKYAVTVYEVHAIEYHVEARSKQDARKIVSRMLEEGDESMEATTTMPEYSHTLEPEDWNVETIS